jgi:VanZ family protein
MASPRLRSFLHWIPAALAVLMIAIESTAILSGDNTSRWLLPLWVHLFGPITPAHWATVHHYLRKTGHFAGYGLVSLCFFHGWRNTLQLTRGGLGALWVRSAVFSVGCTMLVASADEVHQTFLPSRTGRALDVGIDTCGALVVQLLILALMPLFSRKSSRTPAGAVAAGME